MEATGAKGIVAATLGENLPEETAARLMERGIAPLGGVREAFAAIECAAAVGEAWRAPPGVPVITDECLPGSSHDDPLARHRSGALLIADECLPGSPHGDPQVRHQAGAPLPAGEHLPDAPVLLDEAASKARLAAFGVAIPPGAVARGEDEAVVVAASLGGPVAVKALGIAHKTEHGAVRLGLRGPGEIREAARELLALGGGIDGGGGGDGDGGGGRLLVERFAPDVVAELIVGLHRDPQLGLLLTVGSGGTFVELAADSATLLLPVSEVEIREALSGLRSAPLLEGYRGRAPADVDAAVAAILGIARFAVEHRDRLEELDVNPLGVRARGRGAVALDALIRTREAAS